VPGMEEFLAETGSKTLVAASTRLGEVDSELTQKFVADTALKEEEDKKEKNPDTHIKQKRKSPLCLGEVGSELTQKFVADITLK